MKFMAADGFLFLQEPGSSHGPRLAVTQRQTAGHDGTSWEQAHHGKNLAFKINDGLREIHQTTTLGVDRQVTGMGRAQGLVHASVGRQMGSVELRKTSAKKNA